jgi:hypothetical protein
MRITNPQKTGLAKNIMGQHTLRQSSGLVAGAFSGSYGPVTNVDSIRILASNSNINGGTFKLYGIVN